MSLLKPLNQVKMRGVEYQPMKSFALALPRGLLEQTALNTINPKDMELFDLCHGLKAWGHAYPQHRPVVVVRVGC